MESLGWFLGFFNGNCRTKEVKVSVILPRLLLYKEADYKMLTCLTTCKAIFAAQNSSSGWGLAPKHIALVKRIAKRTKTEHPACHWDRQDLFHSICLLLEHIMT